jgi:hypothetical protein
VDLPERVDILVSEWMGFYLPHESMLDSVLVAHDRFLKQTGIMIPQSCRLLAAPVCNSGSRAERVEFWMGGRVMCIEREGVPATACCSILRLCVCGVQGAPRGRASPPAKAALVVAPPLTARTPDLQVGSLPGRIVSSGFDVLSWHGHGRGGSRSTAVHPASPSPPPPPLYVHPEYQGCLRLK